jgi:hypothetical protein
MQQNGAAFSLCFARGNIFALGAYAQNSAVFPLCLRENHNILAVNNGILCSLRALYFAQGHDAFYYKQRVSPCSLRHYACRECNAS